MADRGPSDLRPRAWRSGKLLAGSVSGMNTAGDQWTLTVLGKGKVQVIKQNDSTGNPAALDSATEIKSIILSGTDPTSTRLVEKVTPAAGSSGKIYFENLTEQPNHSARTGNLPRAVGDQHPRLLPGQHRRGAAHHDDQPRGVDHHPRRRANAPVWRRPTPPSPSPPALGWP